MKIERMEVFAVAVPLVGDYLTSHSRLTVQRSIVVRLTTDSGNVGVGNVDPPPRMPARAFQGLQASLEDLAPALKGLEVSNIHSVAARMQQRRVGSPLALAAVEMACIDATARRWGVPVHAYLGGAVLQELEFNAWIGILPPEEAGRQAAEARASGFRSAKVKIGGDPDADVRRVKAVRQAVGADFRIRVDANEGYDAPSAIRLAHDLAPFDLELFEQPVPAADLQGLAAVKAARTGIPVMADESVTGPTSLLKIIRQDAADIVKLKVMNSGGLRRTMDMITIAEAAGMRCVLGHGFGLGVSTLAEIMVAAASRNVMPGLECVGPLKTGSDIVRHKLDLSGGRLPLPTAPGLGAELDEASLARWTI